MLRPWSRKGMSWLLNPIIKPYASYIGRRQGIIQWQEVPDRTLSIFSSHILTLEYQESLIHCFLNTHFQILPSKNSRVVPFPPVKISPTRWTSFLRTSCQMVLIGNCLAQSESVQTSSFSNFGCARKFVRKPKSIFPRENAKGVRV